MIVIIHLERGISSKRKSLTCIDYVPALCTHRPSLLPMNNAVNKMEVLISRLGPKSCKPYYLEEGEVVTRFP